MSPSLSVVADVKAEKATEPETRAQKLKRLQNEIQEVAHESTSDLIGMLIMVEKVANEIRTGGDAFKAGVREEARQIEEFVGKSAERLSALKGRK